MSAATQLPELSTVLFRRTVMVTLAVALVVAIGLGALTLVNVRQEVRAARALVEQAVGASRQALLEPDPAMLRGLRLQLVDGRSGSAWPAGEADGGAGSEAQGSLLARLAEHWFGVSDRFTIPLTDDPHGPALLVQGHAVGELQEQLSDMAIVLLALLFAVGILGLAHRWVVRGVRDPLADMTEAADRMAQGELSCRIAEPRVAEFASLARALNHLAASLSQTRNLQAQLTAELVSLRASERKSLARELHDDVGQRLAVIAAETHLLRAQLKNDDVTVRSIAAGVQSLQHAVRSILGRLRQGEPMMLPDPDAEAILDDWRRREPGVRWQVDPLGASALAGLDDAARDTLARVLHEALANAFRHARPTRVSVRLSQDQTGARLVVCNDGVPTVDGGALGASRHGYGIVGMNERAIGCGGSLHTHGSAVPGHWELVLTLPGPARALGACAAEGGPPELAVSRAVGAVP